MLIAGDVYRPAAIDQLIILGEQVVLWKFLLSQINIPVLDYYQRICQ